MRVPMVDVRPMAVEVVGFLVDVLVDVRLRDFTLVPVDMMQVRMDMGMGVDDPVVMMGMGMFFADDESNRRGHEQAGAGHTQPHFFAQDKDRGKRAGEGGEAEQGARPERAQAFQPLDEQDQAQPVA
jgi:hypothetical protein